MSEVQPARTPPVNAPDSTLQYGDATRLERAQQAVPLPATGTSSGPGSTGTAPPASFDIEQLFHQTQFPDEPVTAGADEVITPARALAYKVDHLRHLATLPYASEEVRQALRDAMAELHEAQSAVLPSTASPLDAYGLS